MPKLKENFYTNKLTSEQELEKRWLESLQNHIDEVYKKTEETQKNLAKDKLILRPQLEQRKAELKEYIKDKCNHYWTKTRGLNKDYYDCKSCWIKYEDFCKQTGKTLTKQELENKDYVEFKVFAPEKSSTDCEQPDMFNCSSDELEDFGYWEDDPYDGN